MPVECARCRFDESAWLAAPTYAFVLHLGMHPAHLERTASEWAASNVVAGATAYCAVCRRVCWLARSECAQAALLQHTVLLRTLAATRNHSFSTDSTGV
jgi:hypothetical protein